jgi:hypothetical protein
MLAARVGPEEEHENRPVPIVYQELRRLAHRYMRGERSGQGS